MNSTTGADILTFGTRSGTRNGVETHIFRVETQRDLAHWSRALVQGSHGSAMLVKEVTCRKYLCLKENKIETAQLSSFVRNCLSVFGITVSCWMSMCLSVICPSVFLFQDDNLNKCKWIFTKLGTLYMFVH